MEDSFSNADPGAQPAPLDSRNNAAPNPTNNGHDPHAHAPSLNGAAPPSDQPADELAPHHRVILEQESAISAEGITARGYRTETDPARLRALGFSRTQAALASPGSPVLVIPLYNSRGECVGYVMKPDIPRNDTRNGKRIKYEIPAGAGLVLDVPPLTAGDIDDPTKPLIVTEGAKTADSAASRGFPVVNLNGVSGYKGKNLKGGITALADWDDIALKGKDGAGTLFGRIVYIIFDSDVTTKATVERALYALGRFLQSRAAVVKVAYLKASPSGEKIGLDDFLARGGNITDLMLSARDLETVKAQRTRQLVAVLDLPGSGAVSFPELPADKIPAPKLTGDYGAPVYDARQIVELIRPEWEVAALTTHAAHAARIGAHMGQDVRFCPQLGWLYFNGRHWEIDDRTNTATAARVAGLSRVVRAESAALYRHAATLAAVGRAADANAMSDSAAEVLRHAKQVEGKAFIDGALHLAAGTLRASAAAFDQRPWLIGFQNGTWDAGTWREHRRDDYLLHLSPVAIDPNADRAEWLAVLERITGKDANFARTLQDVAGYAFSGASHLRLLPWLYGPRATGKSTFAELLQTVLGGLAATVDPKKLHDDAQRERLGADLWNKRVAVCAEAGSQRLAAELLNTLSGSDSLPVRFLYREAFTAPPRHVLIMVANDPPFTDAYNDALRDRVMALPFTHPLAKPKPFKLTGGARIEIVRRDPNSPLVRGFAAWALEGLARLHKTQTISRAECVEKATAGFWADTDPLTLFWETVLEEVLLKGISKTNLRELYEKWCKTEGGKPVKARQWTRACKSRGLLDERRGNDSAWFWYLLPTKPTKQRQNPETSNTSRKENIEVSGNTPRSVGSVGNDEREAF